MNDNNIDHRIDSFLNSLSYWESINLRVTLIEAQDKAVSQKEAYEKATLEFSSPEKMKFDFERAIKSGY